MKNNLLLLLFVIFSLSAVAQKDIIVLTSMDTIFCKLKRPTEKHIYYKVGDQLLNIEKSKVYFIQGDAMKRPVYYNIHVESLKKESISNSMDVLTGKATHEGCFPIKPNTELIEITGTVTMNNLPKEEVFNKLVEWGLSKSTNRPEQPVIIDRESGVFKIYIPVNYRFKDEMRSIYYGITTIVRDGHFDYVIQDFRMNNRAMEVYLNDKKGDRYYNIAFEDICTQLNNTIQNLESLK